MKQYDDRDYALYIKIGWNWPGVPINILHNVVTRKKYILYPSLF